jgi:hypothetical protein
VDPPETGTGDVSTVGAHAVANSSLSAADRRIQ